MSTTKGGTPKPKPEMPPTPQLQLPPEIGLTKGTPPPLPTPQPPPPETRRNPPLPPALQLPPPPETRRNPPLLPAPQLPPPPETGLKKGNPPPRPAPQLPPLLLALLRQFAATLINMGILFIRVLILFQFEDASRALLITFLIMGIAMGRNLLARAARWGFMNSWVTILSTAILLLSVYLLLGSILR